MNAQPFINITPGMIFNDCLKALKLNVKTFSLKSRIPTKTIKQILKAKQPITQEIAEAIAPVFNTTPEFWLKLETNYQKRKLQKEREKEAKKHHFNFFEKDMYVSQLSSPSC